MLNKIHTTRRRLGLIEGSARHARSPKFQSLHFANGNRQNSLRFNNIKISNRYKNGPSASGNRSKIPLRRPAMNRHFIRAAATFTWFFLLAGLSAAAAQSSPNQSPVQLQVQSGIAEINGG